MPHLYPHIQFNTALLHFNYICIITNFVSFLLVIVVMTLLNKCDQRYTRLYFCKYNLEKMSVNFGRLYYYSLINF